MLSNMAVCTFLVVVALCFVLFCSPQHPNAIKVVMRHMVVLVPIRLDSNKEGVIPFFSSVHL